MTNVHESISLRELRQTDAARRGRAAGGDLRGGLLIAVLFSVAAWGGLIALVRLLV